MTKSRKSRGSRRYSSARVKILPTPQKGALAGYSTHLPAPQRRSILDKLVKKKGYATVVHEINLVANYSKRTAPTAHKKMTYDMAYLKKEYRS